MASWQFHLAFVELLARHRTPLLTHFFTAMSAIGSEAFYFLLIVLLYVAWDKRLAVRFSFLMLVTTTGNILLKNHIHNPRPFVSDGSYLQKWAVSRGQAVALAAEFSTPSGHAMGAGSFYSYLYASTRRRWVRITAVMLILLIGFSRPYLGVHYGEDILLGWGLGFGIAFIAVRSNNAVQEFWTRLGFAVQVCFAICGSLVLTGFTAMQGGLRSIGQLEGVIAYAGLFTGMVIACPLERIWVRFNAAQGSAAKKSMRFLIASGLTGCVLTVTKEAIAFANGPNPVVRFLVLYAGYVAAAVAGMFVAPWVFTRIGLAARETEYQGQ